MWISDIKVIQFVSRLIRDIGMRTSNRPDQLGIQIEQWTCKISVIIYYESSSSLMWISDINVAQVVIRLIREIGIRKSNRPDQLGI